MRSIEQSRSNSQNDRDEFFIDAITFTDLNSELNCAGMQSNYNGSFNKTKVNVDFSVSDDTVNNINYNSSSAWSQILRTQGVDIEFKIDTGSQVNIIPYSCFVKLVPRPKLSNTSVTLTAYNNTSVPVCGKCICSVDRTKDQISILFIVTKDDLSPIIGSATSEKLGLIRRIHSISNRVNIESQYTDCCVRNLVEQFGSKNCSTDDVVTKLFKV